MQETTSRNYDVKAVERTEVPAYQSFGWVKSKEPVPEEMMPKKAKQPYVLMKRKFEFGANSALANNEKEYEKLKKKKYRQKPILGIITFILMLALLIFAGVELYFGISSGIEKVKADKQTPAEQPAEGETPSNAAEATEPGTDATEDGTAGEETAAAGPLEQVKKILNDVQEKYLSKVTDIFDGKTNAETGEYTPGIADNLANAMQPPIKYFINANNIVALIALVLAIIFIIIFAEVCKVKKKRAAKAAKMNDILVDSEEIAEEMRRRDLSLMGRTQRKQYMWTNIIANGIRQANGVDEEDDE